MNTDHSFADLQEARSAFRADVFRGVLERALEERYLASDLYAQQMFSSYKSDLLRALIALFPGEVERRILEERCVSAQRRAGIGQDLDGQAPIRLFQKGSQKREGIVLREFAAQIIDAARGRLQKAPRRRVVLKPERIQQTLADETFTAALSERFPLGALQAFLVCSDLVANLLHTGFRTQDELVRLDTELGYRLLDEGRLTQKGVEFFRGVQCRLLDPASREALALLNRLPIELARPGRSPRSSRLVLLHEDEGKRIEMLVSDDEDYASAA